MKPPERGVFRQKGFVRGAIKPEEEWAGTIFASGRENWPMN